MRIGFVRPFERWVQVTFKFLLRNMVSANWSQVLQLKMLLFLKQIVR